MYVSPIRSETPAVSATPPAISLPDPAMRKKFSMKRLPSGWASGPRFRVKLRHRWPVGMAHGLDLAVMVAGQWTKPGGRVFTSQKRDLRTTRLPSKLPENRVLAQYLDFEHALLGERTRMHVRDAGPLHLAPGAHMLVGQLPQPQTNHRR